MAIQSAETIAGVVIPDTALVREATELIRAPKTTSCSTTPGGRTSSARCTVVASGSNQTWNCCTWPRCFTTWGSQRATAPRPSASKSTARTQRATFWWNTASNDPQPTRCG